MFPVTVSAARPHPSASTVRWPRRPHSAHESGEPEAADLSARFHAWLVSEGAVPEVCRDKLPALERGVGGEWHWNPNIDDPTLEISCQPINHFVWRWQSAGSLEVENRINRKGGDRVTRATIAP